jgi:hypothetical protein
MRYEYAGFQFEMELDEQGRAVSARPLAHQHPASRKDKHRRAAIECYNQEQTDRGARVQALKRSSQHISSFIRDIQTDNTISREDKGRLFGEAIDALEEVASNYPDPDAEEGEGEDDD